MDTDVATIVGVVKNFLDQQAARVGKTLEDFPNAKFVHQVMISAQTDEDINRCTKKVEFALAALELGSFANEGVAQQSSSWNSCWTSSIIGRNRKIEWVRQLEQ